jgi:hypothetical protein
MYPAPVSSSKRLVVLLFAIGCAPAADAPAPHGEPTASTPTRELGESAPSTPSIDCNALFVPDEVTTALDRRAQSTPSLFRYISQERDHCTGALDVGSARLQFHVSRKPTDEEATHFVQFDSKEPGCRTGLAHGRFSLVVKLEDGPPTCDTRALEAVLQRAIVHLDAVSKTLP